MSAIFTMHGDKTQMGDDNGVEDVYPQNTFYGSGVQKGPAVVMTDNSMTEKGAMKTMWPSSTQLLCIFHFLQRRWTWLWEGKKIYKNDRAVLINLVKTLVYTPSEISDTINSRGTQLF